MEKIEQQHRGNCYESGGGDTASKGFVFVARTRLSSLYFIILCSR